ncbi:(2Fe-2S)-binding protein [Thermaerobacter subterraneus]|uniref:Aerobic-type carbon monoxide dehydrogenase, small subunit CoxS/CutS-like protein n=1 Tax=Thermaerobacter subterraneus DSM 13965 TaxID=867903 RepID=K6PRX5_9FIRM|nr:(2Fe-2S)-binding protein [Thermaerobacter subterraneus]EKP95707.1 aerobic-type carbon monoxide dehydrogenase, small subunit CoxS/CutS-like protein [Thermaerobacter subterraneus DSM 13965]
MSRDRSGGNGGRGGLPGGEPLGGAFPGVGDEPGSREPEPGAGESALPAFRAQVPVRLVVNGETWVGDVPASLTLAAFLRERLGLMGTKIGCGEGNCGACSVIVDGELVYSCLVPVAACDGSRVETVEGLARGDRLHPIQEAFIAEDALQCGFCTPGQIMAVKALLDREPHPTREQVVAALSGNLCRCGAYTRIVQAALRAAGALGGAGGGGGVSGAATG